MRTVPEIIDEVGGCTLVSRWLSMAGKPVRPQNVSEMKRRGAVPSEYWHLFCAGAQTAGFDWLTEQYLAIVHAAPKNRLLLSALPEPAPAVRASVPVE